MCYSWVGWGVGIELRQFFGDAAEAVRNLAVQELLDEGMGLSGPLELVGDRWCVLKLFVAEVGAGVDAGEDALTHSVVHAGGHWK